MRCHCYFVGWGGIFRQTLYCLEYWDSDKTIKYYISAARGRGCNFDFEMTPQIFSACAQYKAKLEGKNIFLKSPCSKNHNTVEWWARESINIHQKLKEMTLQLGDYPISLQVQDNFCICTRWSINSFVSFCRILLTGTGFSNPQSGFLSTGTGILKSHSGFLSTGTGITAKYRNFGS